MSVINTNYLALVSQNNLGKSQSALGTAIERLSSGMRINSAKDDAAGQAIANRFTANIKGLTQAARNANDGISIAQTTEGSLNEINNNLQRIRELSVQAANGSNSDSDLASIQNEIKERLDEIDRVSRETQFNGKYVLGSDANKLSVQVGAHDNQRIDIQLREINSGTLGLTDLNMNKQVISGDLTEIGGAGSILVEAEAAKPAETVALTLPTGSTATYTYHVGEDGDLYVQNSDNEFFAATYDPDTNTIKVTDPTTPEGTAPDLATNQNGFIMDVGGTETLSEMSQLADATVDDGSTAAYTFHVHTETGAYVLYDANSELTYEATVAADGKVTRGADVTTTLDVHNNGTDFGEAVDILTIPGQAEVDEVTVDMGGVDLEGTNTLMRSEDGESYYIRNEDADGNVSWYSATVDEDSGEVTLGATAMVNPLDAIDKALQQVDDLRSHLGAIQNRFESTIANLNNTVNNLSAARSRIEDADYAVEVSNMTRAQILQQAGTSVLAQANQVPQTVLSLLR